MNTATESEKNASGRSAAAEDEARRPPRKPSPRKKAGQQAESGPRTTRRPKSSR